MGTQHLDPQKALDDVRDSYCSDTQTFTLPGFKYKQFQDALLSLFSDAVQSSPTPHLIRSVLHSPRRRLFIDMYKNINLTISSFPEPQRETIGKVWYQTHPFFLIFREDLPIKDLDTLPDWTFTCHHCVLHNAQEMKGTVEHLFLSDQTKRNSLKYALDWTFASSFKTDEIHKTFVWFPAFHSDEVDVSFWDISALSSLSYMFHDFYKPRITGLQHWDVSQVKTFDFMFACSRVDLTEKDANALDMWDMGSATSIHHMFSILMVRFQDWKGGTYRTYNYLTGCLHSRMFTLPESG
eukprot:CAMPEP_0113874204 /NCGR_PEP_ID=MMETSP0780_2-20120614/4200_1 /TAXON_ID=652834 /ORGANISM="Palpitomonas bilix" /LENGTH=294 /DNA_ID=CAMNT_0000859943 /DNA_START=315 /DNA_END=1196 /DNA_ORIENTATION=+ /assembly_acc=CAM_ASM_000599